MKSGTRITASVLCAAAVLLTGCGHGKPVTQDDIRLPALWRGNSDSFTADGKVLRFYDSGILIDGCAVPSEEFYVFSNPDGDKLFYDMQGRFRAYQYHMTSAYDCSYDPDTMRPEPPAPGEPVQTRTVRTVPADAGIPEEETPDTSTDEPVQMSDREMIRLSLDGWWTPPDEEAYRTQANGDLNMLVPDFKEYTEHDEVICQYDAASGEYIPCRMTARRRYGEAAADRAEIVINIARTVEVVTVEYADISEKDAAAVSEQFTPKAHAFAEEYFKKLYGGAFQGISGISGSCRSISGKVYGFYTVTGTVTEIGLHADEISEDLILSAD